MERLADPDAYITIPFTMLLMIVFYLKKELHHTSTTSVYSTRLSKIPSLFLGLFSESLQISLTLLIAGTVNKLNCLASWKLWGIHETKFFSVLD